MSDEQDFLAQVGLTGNVEESAVPPEGEPPDSDTEPPETEPEKPQAEAAKPDEAEHGGTEEAERIRELEAEKLRLEQEKATLDKRLRDTQAAFTRERQKQKSQEKPAPKEPDDEDWFGDEESSSPEEPGRAEPETAPEPEWKPELEELRARQEELRKAEALRNWAEAEKPVRTQYPDYEVVVDGTLNKAINAGDARAEYLMDEFRKRGATPQAAYEVGQMLMRMEGKDAPAAPAPEPKQEIPAARPDDPGWNSMPPDKEGGAPIGKSPLDELLAEL